MNEQGNSLTAQGKQALIRVAEWLERGAPHVIVKEGVEVARFNMEFAAEPVGDGCGTACCIAGTVCQFEGLMELDEDGSLEFYSDDPEDGEFKGAGEVAREFLDINDTQAAKLFTPWSYFDYTSGNEFSEPKRAAAVVRHFIATGDVAWDLFDADGNTTV